MIKLKAFIVLCLVSINWGCSVHTVRFSNTVNYSIDSSYTKDSALNAAILPFRDSLSLEMDQIVGHTELGMAKYRPECELGNLVADLSRERAIQEIGINDSTPVLVLLNFGGLRSTLPKGPVTRRDVFSLMPFENELVALVLDGVLVREMAKYIIKKGGEPLSGFTMVTDGDSLISLRVDEKPIEANRNYTVITSDYLAKGGDKMYFFKQAKKMDYLGVKVRDAILDHFIAVESSGEKIVAKIDHRIQYVE